MGPTTQLRRVKRGWWDEITYRANWVFFGTIGAIVVAFIPLIGWLLCIGLVFAIIGNLFKFPDVFIQGDCPACSKLLQVNPKKQDVISCPACAGVIKVHPECLELVELNRPPEPVPGSDFPRKTWESRREPNSEGSRPASRSPSSGRDV